MPYTAVDNDTAVVTGPAPGFALHLLDAAPIASTAAESAAVVASVVYRIVEVVSFRYANPLPNLDTWSACVVRQLAYVTNAIKAAYLILNFRAAAEQHEGLVEESESRQV